MSTKKNKVGDKSFTLKDYFRAPIFSLTEMKESRVVKAGENMWTIGIDNPLDATNKVLRTLTIEHALVIFGIFAFADPLNCQQKISFSLNQLCTLIYGCCNSKTYKKAKNLLNGILICWNSIEFSNGHQKIFRVLKNVDIVKKPSRKNAEENEFWLDSVELHEEFYKLISDFGNRLYIEINLIRKISSNLARAIYLYVPSRAINASKNYSVFKISLTKLLEQVGHEKVKYKSVRYRLFAQNKKSIIAQLNGSELLGNKIMNCKLEETKNKKDYNLICWVSDKTAMLKKSNSALYKAFTSAGGSLGEWKTKLSIMPLCEFNMYELIALEYFPFWEESETFLKMAKCLLGDYFAEYLGTVKNHILEEKSITKTPMHMLSYELIRAFENINGRKNKKKWLFTS